MKKMKFQVSFNSPVILGFVIACFVVLILGVITGNLSTQLLFCVYRSSLLSPFTYLRFFGHVLGHSGLEHLMGNMMIMKQLKPLMIVPMKIKVKKLK